MPDLPRGLVAAPMTRYLSILIIIYIYIYTTSIDRQYYIY